ncbi:DNA repair exonuclease [Filibacter tadaridae]|uniref:Putative metallophosphoesterase YhaO n=1 Tax=Filibacter tadaridae TaxID=2483811 RepID=A0A3P5X671_9BACL|nr:DNA repair exonuclease [Filibacter tadaridae]VDC25876.1 putative metallophosphoesterase YhaO [Filibacter tadaridae]
MSSIRFIHTADLHLDSPFKGMTGLPAERLHALRESTFTAFSNLIEYALKSKPDFVLIVGDIYDGENRSLRAQKKFHDGMEKLNTIGIPVFITHGNHDHLAGRWTRFSLPSNVHVFDGNVKEAQLRVNNQEVSIYGFSYKERHVHEAIIEHYPVAGNQNSYHIGMLHGSLAGDQTHDVYAPFTKTELLEKHYDYWALGHIHLRQSLHAEPPIVYPGNLQGRHRNESGEKGFYEVELSKTGASLQFIPSSAIVFERIEVSCGGISHANEWLAACTDVVDTYRTRFGSCIVELTMTDVGYEAAELFGQSTEAEWLEVLREGLDDQESFIWIQKITFNKQTQSAAITSTLVQSVLGQMNGWTEAEWKAVLKDVYQHTRGVKYLDVLSEEDIRDIQTGAASLLTAEMMELK